MAETRTKIAAESESSENESSSEGSDVKMKSNMERSDVTQPPSDNAVKPSMERSDVTQPPADNAVKPSMKKRINVTDSSDDSEVAGCQSKGENTNKTPPARISENKKDANKSDLNSSDESCQDDTKLSESKRVAELAKNASSDEAELTIDQSRKSSDPSETIKVDLEEPERARAVEIVSEIKPLQVQDTEETVSEEEIQAETKQPEQAGVALNKTTIETQGAKLSAQGDKLECNSEVKMCVAKKIFTAESLVDFEKSAKAANDSTEQAISHTTSSVEQSEMLTLALEDKANKTVQSLASSSSESSNNLTLEEELVTALPVVETETPAVSSKENVESKANVVIKLGDLVESKPPKGCKELITSTVAVKEIVKESNTPEVAATAVATSQVKTDIISVQGLIENSSDQSSDFTATVANPVETKEIPDKEKVKTETVSQMQEKTKKKQVRAKRPAKLTTRGSSADSDAEKENKAVRKKPPVKRSSKEKISVAEKNGTQKANGVTVESRSIDISSSETETIGTASPASCKVTADLVSEAKSSIQGGDSNEKNVAAIQGTPSEDNVQQVIDVRSEKIEDLHVELTAVESTPEQFTGDTLLAEKNIEETTAEDLTRVDRPAGGHCEAIDAKLNLWDAGEKMDKPHDENGTNEAGLEIISSLKPNAEITSLNSDVAISSNPPTDPLVSGQQIIDRLQTHSEGVVLQKTISSKSSENISVNVESPSSTATDALAAKTRAVERWLVEGANTVGNELSSDGETDAVWNRPSVEAATGEREEMEDSGRPLNASAIGEAGLEVQAARELEVRASIRDMSESDVILDAQTSTNAGSLAPDIVVVHSAVNDDVTSDVVNHASIPEASTLQELASRDHPLDPSALPLNDSDADNVIKKILRRLDMEMSSSKNPQRGEGPVGLSSSNQLFDQTSFESSRTPGGSLGASSFARSPNQGSRFLAGLDSLGIDGLGSGTGQESLGLAFLQGAARLRPDNDAVGRVVQSQTGVVMRLSALATSLDEVNDDLGQMMRQLERQQGRSGGEGGSQDSPAPPGIPSRRVRGYQGSVRGGRDEHLKAGDGVSATEHVRLGVDVREKFLKDDEKKKSEFDQIESKWRRQGLMGDSAKEPSSLGYLGVSKFKYEEPIEFSYAGTRKLDNVGTNRLKFEGVERLGLEETSRLGYKKTSILGYNGNKVGYSSLREKELQDHYTSFEGYKDRGEENNSQRKQQRHTELDITRSNEWGYEADGKAAIDGTGRVLYFEIVRSSSPVLIGQEGLSGGFSPLGQGDVILRDRGGRAGARRPRSVSFDTRPAPPASAPRPPSASSTPRFPESVLKKSRSALDDFPTYRETASNDCLFLGGSSGDLWDCPETSGDYWERTRSDDRGYCYMCGEFECTPYTHHMEGHGRDHEPKLNLPLSSRQFCSKSTLGLPEEKTFQSRGAGLGDVGKKPVGGGGEIGSLGRRSRFLKKVQHMAAIGEAVKPSGSFQSRFLRSS